MEEIIICSILAVFGLMFGSFAAASVWRLRAYQLVEDKAAGEVVDKKEYKKLVPLTKATVRTDRSRCLHCEHPLAWYDLLPLISWVALRGRCRYCQASIGRFEPLMELAVAAFFVLSFILWPGGVTDSASVVQFVLWLIAGVLLAILFAYDMKWFLLPDRLVFPLDAIGVISAVISVAGAPDLGAAIASLVGAVAILSGLYLVLWHISKGQWIGFGDVKLGLGLGLLLADWKLAFITLFAANLLGCVVVIPGMLMKKITRTTRIPFGPFLIIGAVLAMLCGPWLQAVYVDVILQATTVVIG